MSSPLFRYRRICESLPALAILPLLAASFSTSPARGAEPPVDPIAPAVAEAPVASPLGGPALDFRLTATLDLTRGEVCGADTAVAVPPGTDVRFCYWAGNAGTTTFQLHDLSDMEGVLFTDYSQTLAPGFAMYLMQNRQPLAAGSNLATWTATDGGGGNAATDSDSVPIAMLPPVAGCNLAPTTFYDGLPVGWTSFDWLANAKIFDSEVDWAELGAGGCLEPGNWTGGRGGAACASSDLAGAQAYDTQLRSHSFSLAGVTEARVEFRLNYQDAAAAGDAFTVDVSTDGGDTWTNVAGTNGADFGAFRALPGALVSLDLTPFAGETDLRVGFRYVNQAGGAHDLYAQVDDVAILCDGGLFFDGFESGTTEAWIEGFE